MQEHTARYREEYRAEHVPEGYSGRLHFGLILGFVALVMAVGIWQIDQVRALEWLAVPLTFLYANLADLRSAVRHPRRAGAGRGRDSGPSLIRAAGTPM